MDSLRFLWLTGGGAALLALILIANGDNEASSTLNQIITIPDYMGKVYGLDHDSINVFIPGANDFLMIYRKDSQKISIRTLKSGNPEKKCAPDLAFYFENNVFMSCRESPKIIVYSLADKRVTEFDLSSSYNLNNFLISNIVLDEKDKRLYFINMLSHVSFVIKLDTLVLEKINLGYVGLYDALFIDSKNVILSHLSGHKIIFWDKESFQKVESISFNSPYKIQKNDSKVFVSSTQERQLISFTPTPEIADIRITKLSKNNSELYINSMQIVGNNLFAFSRYNGSIYKIKTSDLGVTAVVEHAFENTEFNRSLLKDEKSNKKIYVLDQKNKKLYEFGIKENSFRMRIGIFRIWS